MNIKIRARLSLLLALCLAPGLTGCAHSAGPWRWQCHYDGAPRSLAEVGVLLVANDPLPLQVRSIDGIDVGPVQEFHLRPGLHVIETQPVSYGLASEMARFTLTLEAGKVYLLTADVMWDRPERQTWRQGSWRDTDLLQEFVDGLFSIPREKRVVTSGTWTPRTEEVGECAAVARALASGALHPRVSLLPSSTLLTFTPPEHWRVAAAAEPGMEGSTQPALACPCVAKGSCNLADAVSAGVVESEVTETGLNFIRLRIRRRIDRTVQITVSQGPFVLCSRSPASVFALTEAIADLKDDEWHALAALLVPTKDIWPAWHGIHATSLPAGWEVFITQCSAHQDDFARLSNLLRRKVGQRIQSRRVGYAESVGVAVVWIIATNADLDNLIHLPHWPDSRDTTAPSVARDRRHPPVDETDAAQAMILLDEAGIDITRKAIWRDRQRIARGVSDPELKNWLER